MRLAIIKKEKCKPTACNHVCSKYCPVNKKGEECIVIETKASIDEKLCVGCAICTKRCPFEAIEIINLPEITEDSLVHRFGQNSFALYNLPTPKENSVLGLLGRNGIGKSTAIEILSGKLKPNFGQDEPVEIKSKIKNHDILKYFETLDKKKVSYKPQNLSSLSTNIKVSELLSQFSDDKKIKELAKELGIEHLLENKLNKLSGGELQKIAILTATLKPADIYFFDEPLAYLDIAERIKISNFIKKIAQGKTVVVVEHDLLILDYLTEYLNIFYGEQSAFGLVSGVKSSSNGVNSYLEGFLKEENLRIREKPITFNFTKNSTQTGGQISEWPEFTKKYENFQLTATPGEIKSNQVIGILGKNGTGKTTFVKCLAGLEDVFVEGKKQKLKLKLDISYKPQYLPADENQTVHEIIIKEKINKKIATMFNIQVLQHKKISELSGGELQRFSIARCLSKHADIYLIDEPSAYLDVEERISAAKAIKEIMIEKEKTAFVVDHDLLLVSYLADSIINFSGQPGKSAVSSEIQTFEKGITELLKDLGITIRKDPETGRPKINKQGSVLDREQKSSGNYASL